MSVLISSSSHRFRLIAAGLLMAVGLLAAGILMKPHARWVLAALAADCPSRGALVIADDSSLQHALACLRAGTTLRLRAGQYGQIQLRGAQNITILAENPAAPPTIERIAIRGGEKVKLRNLVLAGGSGQQQSRLEALNVNGLAVESVSIPGVAGRYDDSVNAIFVRFSSDVSLSHVAISWGRYAIGMLENSRVSISDCSFHHMRTDGFRGGGNSDLTIVRNSISDFHPDPGDHPDAIQLWSTNETKPAGRIMIADNLIVRGDGLPTQGIFVRDTFQKLPFYDVTVTRNVLVGTGYNGIMFDGAHDSRITDNRVYALPGMKSWIRVERGDGVDVTGNVAQLFLLHGNFADHRNQARLADNREIDNAVAAWKTANPTVP